MKAKKIFLMAKESQRLFVLNAGTRQFFDINGNIYLIDGMPNMRDEEFLAYLDVPKHKRDEWDVSMKDIETDVLTDAVNDDLELHPQSVSIFCGGRHLEAFMTDDRAVLWLDEDKLSPLAAAEWTFFLRRSETGESWIAVREGLYLIALLKYELTPEVMPGEALAGRLMELAGVKPKMDEDCPDGENVVENLKKMYTEGT
ncbi:MAG: hypothetical protein IJ381_08405 [Clostridia bacterium]|nr:hypothetical protein [Clostridia bacterium]